MRFPPFPPRSASLGATAALALALLSGAPCARAGEGTGEPDDGAVTVLGTGVLRSARVVVRGTLEKVASVGLGVDVGTVRVAETLWGDAPGKERIRILSNESGYFAQVSPDAIYFLEPLEGGDRYSCRAVIDGKGQEGASRLAAVRRSLEVERKPRAERAAALRTTCFESLGGSDAWTRQNAGREIGHLAETRPGAFSEADLRDLRRAALRERDAALRPLLIDAVQSLSRAAEEGRLAPPDPGAVTLRGAPLFRRLREDPDPKERRRAAEAASREGETAEAPLAEALEKDGDAGVRAAAAEALAGAGSAARSGAALLRRAREDGDAGVRGAAVEALGMLGAADAVAALRSIARSDPPVARAALFALARIRNPDAVDALKGIRVEAAGTEGPGAAEARDLIDFLLSGDFLKQEETLRKVRASGER